MLGDIRGGCRCVSMTDVSGTLLKASSEISIVAVLDPTAKSGEHEDSIEVHWDSREHGSGLLRVPVTATIRDSLTVSTRSLQR